MRTNWSDPDGKETQSQGASCCGGRVDDNPAGTFAVRLRYSLENISDVPEDSNLGLGCGNPLAIGSVRKGESVLELGSGAGFDCFLAARRVGESGLVIGVDMTPEMVNKARENAAKGDYKNVQFRLGEFEHLPIADASVDVVISNCATNLSSDKPGVLKEAFRVLKPGGRLAISDIVTLQPLPEELCRDSSLHASCISGASSVTEVRRFLGEAGFRNIRINVDATVGQLFRDCVPETNRDRMIASATIEASKGISTIETKKSHLRFYRSFE